MLSSAAGVVLKRAMEEVPSQNELPSWAWIVFLVDVIVFLPVIFWMSYTLNHVYPTFAMIEDENPPAYEPLSLSDDTASLEAAGPTPNKLTDGKPHTVTSSLRSINRLLYANGGLSANFRGFFCLLAQDFASSFLYGIFAAFVPRMFADFVTLIAALALVQLSTAWVHIVISPRSPLHFWRRLPPFKKTFDATARPVALYWLAVTVCGWVPLFMAWALHMKLPKVEFGDGTNNMQEAYNAPLWKTIIVILVTLIPQVFILIPAHLVLVRVQASLLSDEVDTVIPFDRSFEGKVEPAVVGGKGYVSMADAWKTFSRAAWKRLIILYVKIFAVSTAISGLISVVLVTEIFLMPKHTAVKQ